MQTFNEAMGKRKRVFLGGTCNDSMWREELLIPKLEIEYFNPVVEDWTEDDYQEELKQRETCDYCLYVITPRMIGTYSIAEVVDDSNKRPEKTIFCYLNKDGKKEFSKAQLKSLNKVGEMVAGNGGIFLKSLDAVAKHVNNFHKQK